MTESIAPRSDQANADDFMSGPRTFTIAEVRKGNSTEQPIDVILVEFPKDRPFKPSKSMRRVMVAAWGPDASTYAGRRMTLYRDPAVRFGGQDVGGIRISHMSHIDKPMTLALTVTRGKRAPYVVHPLADAAPEREPAVTSEQLAVINAGLDRLGITDRETKLAAVSQVIDREIGSAKDLSKAEAGRVIDWVKFEESNAAEPGR